MFGYIEDKTKENEFINDTTDINNYLYKVDEKSKIYIDNEIDRLLITLIMINMIYNNHGVGTGGFMLSEDELKYARNKKDQNLIDSIDSNDSHCESISNMRNFFNYMVQKKENKYNAEVILMISKSMTIFRKIYLEEVSNSLNESTSLDYDIISRIKKFINSNSFCRPSYFFEKVLYFKLIVNLERRYRKEVDQLFSNVKSNMTQNKKIIEDFTSYSLVDLVFENLEELNNPNSNTLGPYLKIIRNGIANYLNKNMIIE